MARPKAATGQRGAKSKAVRDFLAANGKTSSKEIVEKLAANGIEVSAALVNNIKYKGKKKKRRGRKPGRPAGSGRQAAVGKAAGENISFESLVAAKQIAQEMGGIEQARRALDALAKLQ